MANEWQARLGALIRKYRGPMSQTTLAELVSVRAGRRVTQSRLSDHERGQRWGGDLDLLASYADVLGIPVEEMHEAVGLPKVDDDRPRPKTFAEIVAQDKTLSKAAREHLLNQYELLQMATQHERAGQPVLHDDQARARRKRA